MEGTLLYASFASCLGRLGSERLGVWVVNDEEDIDRWIDSPLRQVTTDRPNRWLARRR